MAAPSVPPFFAFAAVSKVHIFNECTLPYAAARNLTHLQIYPPNSLFCLRFFPPPINLPVMSVNKIKPKILVADDDPIYRDMAAETLHQSGYDVVLAAHGGQAIAALAREPFNAATIDLTMPLADGIEVIKTARAAGPNTTTPFVVITGHEDASAVARAYEAGATTFLTKPVNWLLFAHHMNFVVRVGRTENELRETTHAAAFLSDLKSQMLSALAREFQGPIKTIYGFGELIRREVYGPLSPPAYRDMAFDMGAAAQRLNAAFLKLLDLGNALCEQLHVKSEEFLISETLAGIVESVNDQSERRSVRIQHRFELPAEAVLEADRVLFIQAVRSVVANAVRLAPRGSTVELRAWIAEGGELKISALDRGPPISASVMAELTRQAAPRPAIDMEARDVGIRIAKVLTEAHMGKLEAGMDANGSNVVRLDFPGSRMRTRRETAPRAAVPAADAGGRLAQVSAALAQDPRVRFATPVAHATPAPGTPARVGAQAEPTPSADLRGTPL